MASSAHIIGANFRDKLIKTPGLRLSDGSSRTTTDYADILVGDGAPSGAYGRASGVSMLYVRKDASDVDSVLYVTHDGGTTWGAVEVLEQVAEVTILAAAVQTLNATPVELVAAPGAGLAIIVEDIQWFLDHNGVDYDAAASGDTLVAKYTNGSGAAVVGTVAGDTFGGASADAFALAKGVDVVPVANAAVVAHINTGEWYSAAGDGDVKARVRYRVVSLAF